MPKPIERPIENEAGIMRKLWSNYARGVKKKSMTSTAQCKSQFQRNASPNSRLIPRVPNRLRAGKAFCSRSPGTPFCPEANWEGLHVRVPGLFNS